MKKLIALLLVLVLCASLIPAAAADDVDNLIDYLELYMKQNGYPDSYSFSHAGRIVIFDLWADGYGVTADQVRADPSLAVAWKPLTEAVLPMAKMIQEQFDTEMPEIGAVLLFNILDDRDQLTLLVSIAEGQVIYDGVIGRAAYAES